MQADVVGLAAHEVGELEGQHAGEDVHEDAVVGPVVYRGKRHHVVGHRACRSSRGWQCDSLDRARLRHVLPAFPKDIDVEAAADIELEELDEHEAAELFDRICRREMHISSAEFLKGWDAGLYLDADPDEFTGLADVILAVPLVRES